MFKILIPNIIVVYKKGFYTKISHYYYYFNKNN